MNVYRKMNAVRQLLLLLVLLLGGCSDSEQYYLDDRDKVVTNFTEKEWTYTEKGTGYTSEVAYVFHRDGTGGYRMHRVYDTGRVEHEARSFSWKFYTPNFKYIYFDYSRYWELDYLNVSTLGVYEYYYDPVYYTGSGNGRMYHRFQYTPSPEE